MKTLSTVASSMRRSGIREIMELAAGMPGVVHLEVGEPDFNTPPAVISAGLTAAAGGFTKYTPNAGFGALRDAIARKLRQQNSLPATAEEVVVTPGAVCALATAILATVNPGDEVLVPDPGWPNYVTMTCIAGGVPVTYPLQRERGYVPDVEVLERLVTPRTKLLLVNSPGNPTGAVFPRETVAALVALAARHDLYVLSDEVYEDFVFDGRHETAAQFDRDGRVISVFGFSKTYAMTGWRLGYVLARPPVAALVGKLQEPLVSCASSVSQKAGEAALLLPRSEVEAMRAAYQTRRDLVVDLLGAADLLASVPRGAFYALVDVSAAGVDSYAVARDLLARERVATAPGETFGALGAGTVRISFATSADLLAEGCARIVRYVKARGRMPTGRR